jgi:hypothetical protein
MSIKAMARGGSGRSTEESGNVSEVMGFLWRLVALLILAVRANAGDFDNRHARRKSG